MGLKVHVVEIGWFVSYMIVNLPFAWFFWVRDFMGRNNGGFAYNIYSPFMNFIQNDLFGLSQGWVLEAESLCNNTVIVF